MILTIYQKCMVYKQTFWRYFFFIFNKNFIQELWNVFMQEIWKNWAWLFGMEQSYVNKIS